MAFDLSTPIDQLRSVGSKSVSRLVRLGITTVRDLLWHLPARYEDFSQRIAISDLEVGTKVTIQGEVVKTNIRRIFPRRMTVVESVIRDDTGAVKATWFNQPYIATTLSEGTQVSLAGTVKLDKRGLYLASPSYEKLQHATALRHTAGLIPVYPETEGITSKYLRFLIQPLLSELRVQDPLPPAIRKKYHLPDLATALKQVHYPSHTDDVEPARQRLAFDDLILFQLKALIERRRVQQQKSPVVSVDIPYIKELIEKLPFTLTGDQKVAAWEILTDLGKSYPMNRLLEGDVGSGKTVVAFLAAMQVAQHGMQSVLMAPTEVLAYQHFQTIRQLSEHFDVSLALLTSSHAVLNGAEASKRRIKEEILQGKIALTIGTHAVLQEDVAFDDLALVVVDEQHRFGINQRAALIKSSRSGIPHLLSMTATPIPRTLALTIFGDLDISLLQQKPAKRRDIITNIVLPYERSRTNAFIDEQINAGRQVFIVCPRIEAGTGVVKAGSRQAKLALQEEVKAVTQEYERLKKDVFPHRKIAMLHGKLKPKEKQSTMTAFKDGWYDILVSTSVIEVGVDIPNASLMVIEGADRFGLAQLHQFRGRVGRGQEQSYCFLIPSTDDQAVNRRLEALVASSNGFELAEQDMALRGPGEFFGLKQSGMPDLTMAALADVDLIKKARLEARAILRKDPNLHSYPLLAQRLEEFRQLSHFE